MGLILPYFLKSEKLPKANFLYDPCPDHWKHESVEEDHPALHIFQFGGIDRDLQKDRVYLLPVLPLQFDNGLSQNSTIY